MFVCFCYALLEFEFCCADMIQKSVYIYIYIMLSVVFISIICKYSSFIKPVSCIYLKMTFVYKECV